MNTANRLYETFTKSTDPKVIIDTAIEIKEHFTIVSNKEPCDEIGEEFSYLIGGKNETFEWFLLLIILYLNSDGYNEYFTSLSKKHYLISIKQCEWAILILKEIRPKLDDSFIEFCDDLILHLEKTIEEKYENKENIEGDYSLIKDSRNVVAGIWLRDSNLASNKNIIAMLLMENDANNLVESALLGNFRIVSNSYDDKGGVFIMFGSELAPCEKNVEKESVNNNNKKWWEFWKQGVYKGESNNKTDRKRVSFSGSLKKLASLAAGGRCPYCGKRMVNDEIGSHCNRGHPIVCRNPFYSEYTTPSTDVARILRKKGIEVVVLP